MLCSGTFNGGDIPLYSATTPGVDIDGASVASGQVSFHEKGLPQKKWHGFTAHFKLHDQTLSPLSFKPALTPEHPHGKFLHDRYILRVVLVAGLGGTNFAVIIPRPVQVVKKGLYKIPTLGTFNTHYNMTPPNPTFGASAAQRFEGWNLQNEGPSKAMFWGIMTVGSLQVGFPFLSISNPIL